MDARSWFVWLQIRSSPSNPSDRLPARIGARRLAVIRLVLHEGRWWMSRYACRHTVVLRNYILSVLSPPASPTPRARELTADAGLCLVCFFDGWLAIRCLAFRQRQSYLGPGTHYRGSDLELQLSHYLTQTHSHVHVAIVHHLNLRPTTTARCRLETNKRKYGPVPGLIKWFSGKATAYFHCTQPPPRPATSHASLRVRRGKPLSLAC